MSRACRLPIQATVRCILPVSKRIRRFPYSVLQHEQDKKPSQSNVDVGKLLSKPVWSVSSLLPPKDTPTQSPEISSKQLHHLLRLSALPPPKDADEEAKMLSTLSSQLHFVKEIQKVDTSGVEPLRSLRDETRQGEEEAELGMDAMQDVLAQEEVRGKHHRRIRRKRDQTIKNQADNWDALGTATRKVGRLWWPQSLSASDTTSVRASSIQDDAYDALVQLPEPPLKGRMATQR